MNGFFIIIGVAIVLASCSHGSSDKSEDVTDPAITAAAADYYIDNNVYIGAEIVYDISQKSKMPIADTMSGIDKAKWAAAIYRYFLVTKLSDGKYVCHAKDGAELNISEKVFEMLDKNLDEMNRWTEMQREQGDLQIPLITSEYLDMLHNLNFEDAESVINDKASIESVLNELADTLHHEKCSCVIKSTEGQIVLCYERGVLDLMRLLKAEPELLSGAAIADKVIGKGAAALMIVGGVAGVYADVMSVNAKKLFESTDIVFRYKTLTDNIINRAGTGICPVETLCRQCTTAEECLPLIEGFVSSQNKD